VTELELDENFFPLSIHHLSIPCDGQASGGCWLFLFKNNCQVGFKNIFWNTRVININIKKEFGVG